VTRAVALWAAAALALGGCAHTQDGRQRTTLSTQAGDFTFEFVERDRPWALRVQQAVQNATPALAQWGGLNAPVLVQVLPTHEALEKAAGRRGYPWLKAWARYDDVLLQSPRTWSLFGAAQADVDELVLHELTHAVMYQQASDSTRWRRRHIPLWFREGMASWTAKQGYRWPTLEDLARYVEAHPTRDPVADPDPLYRDQSEIVYAAAHHAFTFLVRRYGQPRIVAVLQRMKDGADFDRAFAVELGVGAAQFTSDFKRYVRLRGFRGGRALPRLFPPGARPLEESVPTPVPSLEPLLPRG
jgi:hypothetical protein